MTSKRSVLWEWAKEGASCYLAPQIHVTVTTRANTDCNGTSADIVIGPKKGISPLRKQNAGAN